MVVGTGFRENRKARCHACLVCWEREVARRENPSVHSSAAIQALLSPRASAALDRALRYERVIYDAAVVVHDRRCLAHLGSEECAA